MMKKLVKKDPPKTRQSWVWVGVAVALFSVLAFKKIHHASPALVPEVQDFSEVNWQRMGDTISRLADTYKGEVGIIIKDLKTGRVFERNADEKFVTASLIKVPIMAATCRAIQDGKLKLTSTIKIRNYHRRGGSGDLKWARSGQSFQISDLLYHMITKSDNTAAAMLIDRLSYTFLNQCFQDLGLSVTRIDPVGMSLANRVNPGRENYTTPREMAMLLEKIYRHQVVNDMYSDLMIEIMKHNDTHNRLSQFLPTRWILARKSGLLRKNCHDMGIIFTGSSDYVICVMTGKNPNYQTAKGVIANIGQTAYAFLGNS